MGKRKVAPLVIFTVGHSTHSIEEFLALLRAHGVRRVVDVRTVPRSRHNPQFNRAELSAALRRRGLRYRHLKALGGLRRPRPDSPNTAWRHSGFRGYADYMQTPEFEPAVERLIAVAREMPTTVLCAEAVPWRCHRSVLADGLTVRGVEVRHILSPTSARRHTLTAFARVRGRRITYPAPEGRT